MNGHAPIQRSWWGNDGLLYIRLKWHPVLFTTLQQAKTISQIHTGAKHIMKRQVVLKHFQPSETYLLYMLCSYSEYLLAKGHPTTVSQ